jgi:hypothetical protein
MSGHHDFENGYKRGYADGLAANAAPDLLEVLKKIAASDESDGVDGPFAEIARAAIEKAEEPK